MTSHESSQNAESTRNVLNVGHTIIIAPGTSLPHRSRNGGRGAGTAPLGDSTPSGAPSKQGAWQWAGFNPQVGSYLEALL
jgi:hypothetical protein